MVIWDSSFGFVHVGMGTFFLISVSGPSWHQFRETLDNGICRNLEECKENLPIFHLSGISSWGGKDISSAFSENTRCHMIKHWVVKSLCKLS